MKAKAVNLKREPYDVYVGRAGKGKNGYFGNPVVVGKPCPECGQVHKTGGSTLPCYTEYLIRKLMADQEFAARVVTRLEGKRLGCFCKPKPCHADVLAAAANWPHNPNSPYETRDEFFAELRRRVQKFK